MKTITLIGVSSIFFYCIIQILSFYGVGMDVYGAYVLFYILLIVCILTLPNNYPSL